MGCGMLTLTVPVDCEGSGVHHKRGIAYVKRTLDYFGFRP